mgnify:CR=1 FL=1
MEITAALLLFNGFLIAIFHGVPSGLEPKAWTFPPKFKRADFTLCSFKILINLLPYYYLILLCYYFLKELYFYNLHIVINNLFLQVMEH